jgi:hypothetical protein
VHNAATETIQCVDLAIWEGDVDMSIGIPRGR